MSVIECRNVSKVYRFGTAQTNLRTAIPELCRALIKGRPAPSADAFWALDNVSFAVEQGEIMGVIGHNGAGKSTLLKLLSRVTFPTSGRVRTHGRVAALIELGAGFHPDLTGRENVYLNGAILGLKRREIVARFAEIVEFAGLAQFIDTPIKRYSSGMYVRLAFAVAAHVNADLLLVDEVLSVGDAAFQQKCQAKMRELHRAGATIVLISHDTWTVQQFCQRVVLLSGGKIVADGSPEPVVDCYQQQARADILALRDGNQGQPNPTAAVTLEAQQAQISAVELLDRAGQPEQAFGFAEHLTVRVSYHAPLPIAAPVFLVRIRRIDGLVCCALNSRNVTVAGQGGLAGTGVFEARIGPLPLVPDLYTIEVHIIDRAQPLIYASGESAVFRIKGALSNARDAGVFAPNVEWHALA